MSREAMKLALEALEKCREGFEYTRQYVGYETLPAIEGWSWYDGDAAAVKAITTLREALAEPARPYRLLQDNGSKYFGESWDKPAQPTVPDALTPADKESPEYTDGWNDCRQAMLAS